MYFKYFQIRPNSLSRVKETKTEPHFLSSLETVPMDFTHSSILTNDSQNVVIRLPWSMSLMFRTVEKSGSLMEVMLSDYGSLLQVWVRIACEARTSFTSTQASWVGGRIDR